MLFAGALALLIIVVAVLLSLLALDLGRRENRHWLDAVKSWQQLIGSTLGFLGAAGVLVLSTAIQSNNDQVKAAKTAYTIGYGLAQEVQTLGLGLRAAQQIGHKDLALPDPGSVCTGYLEALKQNLVSTRPPVFDAVLPRLVDFGYEDLAAFVTFYALYAEMLRIVADVESHGSCGYPETAPVFMQYMVSKIDALMLSYQDIANRYPIYVPQVPQQTSAPASSSEASNS
jgi:hypothetical protein